MYNLPVVLWLLTVREETKLSKNNILRRMFEHKVVEVTIP
jgi:hypothetical protein